MTLAVIETDTPTIARTPDADTLERRARTEIGTPLQAFISRERGRGLPAPHIMRAVCMVIGAIAGKFLAEQEVNKTILNAGNTMCDVAGTFSETGFDAYRETIAESAKPKRNSRGQQASEIERLLVETRTAIESNLAHAESLERDLAAIRAAAGKPIKTPRDLRVGTRRD